MDAILPLVFLAILISLPLHDLQYGPQAAFIAESFPGRVRYSGSALGYQLASLTAGGPAPMERWAIPKRLNHCSSGKRRVAARAS